MGYTITTSPDIDIDIDLADLASELEGHFDYGNLVACLKAQVDVTDWDGMTEDDIESKFVDRFDDANEKARDAAAASEEAEEAAKECAQIVREWGKVRAAEKGEIERLKKELAMTKVSLQIINRMLSSTHDRIDDVYKRSLGNRIYTRTVLSYRWLKRKARSND